MPSPIPQQEINRILSDQDFRNLPQDGQDRVLNRFLQADPDFSALPEDGQSRVRQRLLQSVRQPTGNKPTLAQQAAGVVGSLAKGQVELLPEETVRLPVTLGELGEAIPPLSFPTTGETMEQFKGRTGLEQSPGFFQDTGERFDTGDATLSRQTLQGITQPITEGLGLNQVIEQSGLPPEVVQGLEIAGSIVGAGSFLKRSLQRPKPIKSTDGVRNFTITPPQGGEKLIEGTTPLSAPKVLVQETDKQARVTADMVTGNRFGIPDDPFDSPAFDRIGPAKRRVRFTGADALTVIDETPGLRGGGEFLRKMKGQWEQRTMSSFVDLDTGLSQIWGKRGSLSPIRRNPLRAKGMNQYNISQNEIKALVNFMYEKGQNPEVLKHLSPESSAKVQQTAQLLFQAGTAPRIQQAIDMAIPIRKFDFETGEFTDVFRDRNDMFIPHIPSTAKSAEDVSAFNLNLAFKAAKAREPGMTMNDFKRRLNGYAQNTNDPRAFRGLERERFFDAKSAGNGSAYDGLKAFGYETDPLRAILHYTSAADRRIVQEGFGDGLLMLREKAALADKDTGLFVNRVIDRMTGKNLEIVDQQTTDALAKLRSINTASLLQFATLSNLNQLTFIANKNGVLNTIQAATGKLIPRMLQTTEGRKQRDVVARSGALFSQVLSEFTEPTHKYSRWAQAQLFMNGFSAAERWMRSLAAHAGVMEAGRLARKYDNAYKNNPRGETTRQLERKLQAFGVNPNEVITANGALTEQSALNVAQRTANQTAGRQDPSGLPELISRDSELIKTLFQFKQFGFVNLAEARRQILSEPTIGQQILKAGKLLGTGQVVGEVTRDLQGIAFNLFTDKNGLDTKTRVPKALRNLGLGDEWARVIDNELAGVSGIYALAAMATLMGERAVEEEIGGPTLALIGDVFTIAKEGVVPVLTGGDPTPEALRRTLRRLPVIGPAAARGVEQPQEPFSRIPGGIPDFGSPF